MRSTASRLRRWSCVVIVLGACGGESSSTSGGSIESGCGIGDTRECIGAAACEGAQICLVTREWSSCDCGDGGAGGSAVGAGGLAGGGNGSAGDAAVGGDGGAGVGGTDADASAGMGGSGAGSAGLGGAGGVGGSTLGAGGSGGAGGSAGASGTGGATGEPRSCVGLEESCGPNRNEDCCRSLLVTGGTFNRSNDPSYPATVSTFVLDRFEVTVGRFRRFLAAYDAWRAAGNPVSGAGAHPLLAGSGWDPAWSPGLPSDAVTFASFLKCYSSFASWTDTPGANENKPINCVASHEAFAFCAWDGGRFPTEAEWNYAAAGGSEQRTYPWGEAAPTPSLASYDCRADGLAGCTLADLLDVGTNPAGDGKYGHADLSGNVWEWDLDRQNCCSAPWPAYATTTCIDCSTFADGGERMLRGGGFSGPEIWLKTSFRGWGGPRVYDIGLRCARGQ